MKNLTDRELARAIAEDVAAAGGRVYFVGGIVRDEMMGVRSKDVDVEVYGVSPARLREILSRHGTVLDKGASFGVLGLRGSDLDIAMPRLERRTGALHTDFDVSVNPFMSPCDARYAPRFYDQRDDAGRFKRRNRGLLGRQGGFEAKNHSLRKRKNVSGGCAARIPGGAVFGAVSGGN